MLQVQYFNSVHLYPKNPKFEHGGAKLASCPGRHVTRYAPSSNSVFLCVVRVGYMG